MATCMSQGARVRPTGVTVLAILEIIGAILSLMAAAAFFAVGALVGAVPELGPMSSFFGLLGAVVGAALILLAIVGFVLAYGFWTGKGWAWILGIVFSIIGILIGVVSVIGNPGGVITIIINALILYYLTRPHVKAWFGKA